MGCGWSAEIDAYFFHHGGHRGAQRKSTSPPLRLRSGQALSHRTRQGWGTLESSVPCDSYSRFIWSLFVWNDLRLVEQFGAHLDSRANDETIRDLMIKGLLKIRVKKGGVHYLKL